MQKLSFSRSTPRRGIFLSRLNDWLSKASIATAMAVPMLGSAEAVRLTFDTEDSGVLISPADPFQRYLGSIGVRVQPTGNQGIPDLASLYDSTVTGGEDPDLEQAFDIGNALSLSNEANALLILQEHATAAEIAARQLSLPRGRSNPPNGGSTAGIMNAPDDGGAGGFLLLTFEEPLASFQTLLADIETPGDNNGTPNNFGDDSGARLAFRDLNPDGSIASEAVIFLTNSTNVPGFGNWQLGNNSLNITPNFVAGSGALSALSQIDQIDVRFGANSGGIAYIEYTFADPNANHSIGSTVFQDNNGDGFVNAGDTLLSGVEVRLLDNSPEGNIVARTTTDSNGNYLFTGLRAGKYRVEIDADQFAAGGPLNGLVSIPGTVDADNNIDGNDDGIPFEGGVRSPIIMLTRDGELTSTNGEDNAFGGGQDSNLPGGDDNGNMTVDFGFTTGLASVGDLAFFDANNNGIQDVGETGVGGVLFQIVDSAGNVITGPNGLPLEAISAPDGTWAIEGIPAGNYRLKASSNTPTLVLTTQGAGGNGLLDSSYNGVGTTMGFTGNFSLSAGQVNPTLDAGFVSATPSVTEFDYGDAPNSYQTTGGIGARHQIVDQLALGQSVDAENDGAPGSGANGDDNNGTDDEDGVTFPDGTVISGGAANFVAKAVVRPGASASPTLTAWIDFDGNGTFDSDEATVVNAANLIADGITENMVMWNNVSALVNGFSGQTYARFRVTTDTNIGSNTPGGLAGDGEVEDYPIFIGQPAALGNLVYLDSNNSGRRAGATELPISGVQVDLFDATDTDFSNPLATDFTGGVGRPDGVYEFTNLDPALDYVIRVIPPAFAPNSSTNTDLLDNQQNDDDNGIQAGPGDPIFSPVIALNPGETDNTIDFGLYTNATVGDFVFLDSNNDGDRDAGENGIPNVIVELFNAADTGFTNPLDDTTTDATGFYQFDDVTPALTDFVVKFTQPAGSNLVAAVSGADNPASPIASMPTMSVGPAFTISSGDDIDDQDAAFTPGVSLGNLVFFDQNDDGILNGSDDGINGLTVELLAADGTTVLATDTTATEAGQDGRYLFEGLTPNTTYFVRVTPNGSFPVASTPRSGANNQNSGEQTSPGQPSISEPIALGSNDDLTVDFGFTQLGGAAIGDLAFFDADGDGIQDPDEPGVEGVIFEVFDSSNNSVGTATTGSDGTWFVGGLVPGSYTVQVTAPSNANFTLTTQNAGSDDARDSDFPAGGTTGTTGVITLGNGETNPTIDAGFVLPAPGSDFSDAPAALNDGNAPSHVISSPLRFGSVVDAENSEIPSTGADGDDSSPAGSADDEDGITFPNGTSIVLSSPVPQDFVAKAVVTQDTLTSNLSAMDNFDVPNGTPVNYSLGSGWTGPWTETGDDNDPATGDVRVNTPGNQVTLDGSSLGADNEFALCVTGPTSARRTFDFSASSTDATLTFSYRREGLEIGDTVRILVEQVGNAGNFVELGTLVGEDPDANDPLDYSTQFTATVPLSILQDGELALVIESVNLDGQADGQTFDGFCINDLALATSVSAATLPVNTLTATDAFDVPSGANVSYGLGSGWTGPWTETGDDGNPSSGDVLVNTPGNQVTVEGSSLGADNEYALCIQGPTSISRNFDFSSASGNGTLTFSYRREALEPGDQVAIRVEEVGNPGNSVLLGTISGSDPDANDPLDYSTQFTAPVPLSLLDDGELALVFTSNLDGQGGGLFDGFCINDLTLSAPSASAALSIVAWIDFDRDQTFEPAEAQVLSGSAVVADGVTENMIMWTGAEIQSLLGGAGDNTYARFRVSSDPALTASLPGGSVNDGEVEDYLLTFSALSSLGNLVFFDTDGDGNFEPNEGDSPIGGVTVELLDSNNNVVNTTTTDSVTGEYLFTGLDGGQTYVVRVTPPASAPLASSAAPGGDNQNSGNQPTAGQPSVSDPIFLPGSTDDLTVDFGFQPRFGLGNLVFLDNNDNGFFDAGDTGVNGVELTLFDAADLNTPLDMQTTSTLNGQVGSYLFSELPAGCYVVQVDAENFATTAQGGNGILRIPAGPLNASVINDGDTGTDDDAGQNGKVSADPETNGVFSDKIVLGPALNEPSGSDESGVSGSSDDASDDNIDLTVDFGFRDFVADPQGCFYVSGTGEVIPGGGISVQLTADASGNPIANGPVSDGPGGVVDSPNILVAADGTDGCFSWSAVGMEGEFCVTYTLPSGYVLDPAFDFEGNGGTEFPNTSDDTPFVANTSGITPVNGEVAIGQLDNDNDGFLDANTGSVSGPAGSTAANPSFTKFLLQDGDPAIIGVNIPLVKANNFDAWVASQGASFPAAGQPGAGPLGNPDNDAFSNLIEYALCFKSTSGLKVFSDGTPGNGGFQIERVEGANGIGDEESTVNACYFTPGGASDLNYVLQTYNPDAAGTVADPFWVDVTVPAASVSTSDGPAGSTKVTISDLEDVLGLSGSDTDAILRLSIALTGVTPAVSDVSDVQGFNRRVVDPICETGSEPFGKPCLFTGTISLPDGGDGFTIDFADSLNGDSLETVIVDSLLTSFGNPRYYIEVIDPNSAAEGEFLDIESVSGSTARIANDSDLFAGPINSTHLGALDASFDGALVVIREHSLLSDVVPLDPFNPGLGVDDSSQILLLDRSATTSQIESLALNVVGISGGQLVLEWRGVGAENFNDRVVPPFEGLYTHNRGATNLNSFELIQYGEVRTNAVNVPLQEGDNLIGAIYPVDQSPRSRNILTTNGFSGSFSPNRSDQIQNWLGDAIDADANGEFTEVFGFDTSFLLVAGNLNQWNAAGSGLDNRTDDALFENDRAAVITIFDATAGDDGNPDFKIPSQIAP